MARYGMGPWSGQLDVNLKRGMWLQKMYPLNRGNMPFFFLSSFLTHEDQWLKNCNSNSGSHGTLECKIQWVRKSLCPGYFISIVIRSVLTIPGFLCGAKRTENYLCFMTRLLWIFCYTLLNLNLKKKKSFPSKCI